MKVNKFTCKKCGERYKVVTSKHYCAYCHKEEFGEWPKEFSGGINTKGNPNPPSGQHMKFKKTKSRNKRKKKK